LQTEVCSALLPACAALPHRKLFMPVDIAALPAAACQHHQNRSRNSVAPGHAWMLTWQCSAAVSRYRSRILYGKLREPGRKEASSPVAWPERLFQTALRLA